MSEDVFYEVVQNRRSVGFFKSRDNAEKCIDQFNTKVEIAPLKIIKREFLDRKLEDDLRDSFYDGGINWDVWK